MIGIPFMSRSHFFFVARGIAQSLAATTVNKTTAQVVFRSMATRLAMTNDLFKKDLFIEECVKEFDSCRASQ